MKPSEVIDLLAKANSDSKGRLWLSNPMTNIPLGNSDLFAGKILKAMNEFMPDKSTVQDYLNAILEVLWWIIFFSCLQDDKAFEKKIE